MGFRDGITGLRPESALGRRLVVNVSMKLRALNHAFHSSRHKRAALLRKKSEFFSMVEISPAGHGSLISAIRSIFHRAGSCQVVDFLLSRQAGIQQSPVALSESPPVFLELPILSKFIGAGMNPETSGLFSSHHGLPAAVRHAFTKS
jgi:hypothetical protein